MKIAGDTVETTETVRHRVRRGKRAVGQSGQPHADPSAQRKFHRPPIKKNPTKEGTMKIQEKPLGVGLILLLSVGLLAACSGTMKGMVQQGGGSVHFQFEDTGIGHGKLRATLSDGEAFKGRFADEASSGYVTEFDTEGTGATIVHKEAFKAVESYSGNIEAILFGNKGHTMRCKFHANNSFMGLPSGGEGRCEVSDGRVIDVQF